MGAMALESSPLMGTLEVMIDKFEGIQVVVVVTLAVFVPIAEPAVKGRVL